MEAVAMMQRNLALSLATASLAPLADCATGYRPPVACRALLLSTAAIGTLRTEKRARHHRWLKTLEICFRIPDIDTPFASSGDRH